MHHSFSEDNLFFKDSSSSVNLLISDSKMFFSFSLVMTGLAAYPLPYPNPLPYPALANFAPLPLSLPHPKPYPKSFKYPGTLYPLHKPKPLPVLGPTPQVLFCRHMAYISPPKTFLHLQATKQY